VSPERIEHRFIEDLRDEAHVLVDHDPGTITDRDARRFLAAVLERVQAVVGELGHVLPGGPDPENPAGVPRWLIGWIWIM
jgi:hypothetical protein